MEVQSYVTIGFLTFIFIGFDFISNSYIKYSESERQIFKLNISQQIIVLTSTCPSLYPEDHKMKACQLFKGRGA